MTKFEDAALSLPQPSFVQTRTAKQFSQLNCIGRNEQDNNYAKQIDKYDENFILAKTSFKCGVAIDTLDANGLAVINSPIFSSLSNIWQSISSEKPAGLCLGQVRR